MEIIFTIDESPKEGEVNKLWESGYEDRLTKTKVYSGFSLVSLNNCKVIERGFIYQDQNFLFEVGNLILFPRYIKKYFLEGKVYKAYGCESIHNLNVSTLKEIKLKEAFTFIHFNQVYGHWLIEMLPKLIVINEAYKQGIKLPIILPITSPAFMITFALEINPEFIFLQYDPNYETISVEKLFAVGFTDENFWGNNYFNYSSLFKCDVNQMENKIFLIRPKNFSSIRGLKNEIALLRGHKIGYVMPEEGPINWNNNCKFSINLSVLEERINSNLS
jgi:hypothetical protein